MNILELNAHAKGILTYLQAKSTDPREGLAILGIAICMIYDSCSTPESRGFDKFVEDFHKSLLDTYKDVSQEGPGSLQ